jgi:hypothetical protein
MNITTIIYHSINPNKLRLQSAYLNIYVYVATTTIITEISN